MNVEFILSRNGKMLGYRCLTAVVEANKRYNAVCVRRCRRRQRRHHRRRRQRRQAAAAAVAPIFSSESRFRMRYH